MAEMQILSGRWTQGKRPEWQPLIDLIGEELVGDFMWMFEVVLSDGSHLQAYKHRYTRRYIHLNRKGTASRTTRRTATSASMRLMFSTRSTRRSPGSAA